MGRAPRKSSVRMGCEHQLGAQRQLCTPCRPPSRPLPWPGLVQDKFKVPAPAHHYPGSAPGGTGWRQRKDPQVIPSREGACRDSVGQLTQVGRPRPREKPLAQGHTDSQCQSQEQHPDSQAPLIPEHML